MNVELDKGDLMNLVISQCPSYELMDEEPIRKLGWYTGGFTDKWDWNRAKLKELTEEQLNDLYMRLKNQYAGL